MTASRQQRRTKKFNRKQRRLQARLDYAAVMRALGGDENRPAAIRLPDGRVLKVTDWQQSVTYSAIDLGGDV